MDYPRYRQEGLPITSAHMKSLVKEMNDRVKGTEKFWNDGPAAEAILLVRAAALSDDDRLRKHMRSRPGKSVPTQCQSRASGQGGRLESKVRSCTPWCPDGSQCPGVVVRVCGRMMDCPVPEAPRLP